VLTVELAGVCEQTLEQVFVFSRSGSLDGQDESFRESGVTVAQLGQLHRKRGQPTTQHLTPTETEE